MTYGTTQQSGTNIVTDSGNIYKGIIISKKTFSKFQN